MDNTCIAWADWNSLGGCGAEEEEVEWFAVFWYIVLLYLLF